MNPIICHLKHRDEFPIWLNEAGLIGTGVEVGVFEGVYSAQILKDWKGGKLFGIDPYIHYDELIYRDGANRPDLDEIGKRTMELFANEPRYELRMLPSLEAAPEFNDEAHDFVYIDGNHRYECARNDIAAWWPKIKSGGVLGAHDFYRRDDDGQLGNVAQAVWEFAYKLQIPFWVTPDTSAWILKP